MYTILLLLASTFLRVASLDANRVDSRSPVDPSSNRVLRAARRHSELVRRSNDFSLAQKINLVYVEGHDNNYKGSKYFSQLQLQADKPILFLENYDHLLTDVDCHESTMTITLQDEDAYNKARTAFEFLTNGIVVSSHLTCSDNGAHAVSTVLGLQFDEALSRISLQLEPSMLDEAFTHKTFDFGQTDKPHIIHQHDRLSRRGFLNDAMESIQGAIDDAKSFFNDLGDDVKEALKAAGEVIDDAFQQNDSENTASLDFSQIDTTFTFPIGGSLPFDLGCTNCTGKGSVILRTAHLEFGLKDLINNEDDDPIKSGYVELEFSGFEMSIGLRVTPPPIPFSESFSVFKIPLINMQIPGVGNIGLGFEFDLQFEAQADTGVELGFGFDVVVPDSIIRADIAETQNSGFDGFNPTITAHRISANSSNVDVFLLAGFQQKYAIGLEILKVSKQIGPFLSLPNLTMNVTHLDSTQVGANCEANGETDLRFQQQFEDVVHVEYKVGIGAGIDMPDPIPDILSVETDFPLATQCLVKQTDGPGFADATAVLASITAAPAPTAIER